MTAPVCSEVRCVVLIACPSTRSKVGRVALVYKLKK